MGGMTLTLSLYGLKNSYLKTHQLHTRGDWWERGWKHWLPLWSGLEVSPIARVLTFLDGRAILFVVPADGSMCGKGGAG